MLIVLVVNPIRNLNHYSFAALHKLNYESNSISTVGALLSAELDYLRFLGPKFSTPAWANMKYSKTSISIIHTTIIRGPLSSAVFETKI